MANNLKEGVESLYFYQANKTKEKTWQKIMMKIVLVVVTCSTVFFISKSIVSIMIGFFIWFALYGFGHYIAKWDVF